MARQALLIAPDDFVLGKPEAPVTIIEYSSLTCPHCSFHRETLPLLKERFIDTGKAKRYARLSAGRGRFASRDGGTLRMIPLERPLTLRLWMFCSASKEWATAQDPMTAIGRLVAFAGLKPEAFQALRQQ